MCSSVFSFINHDAYEWSIQVLSFNWSILPCKMIPRISVVNKYKWRRGSQTVIKILVAKSTSVYRSNWVSGRSQDHTEWASVLKSHCTDLKICFHLSGWLRCLYGCPNKKQEKVQQFGFLRTPYWMDQLVGNLFSNPIVMSRFLSHWTNQAWWDRVST